MTIFTISVDLKSGLIRGIAFGGSGFMKGEKNIVYYYQTYRDNDKIQPTPSISEIFFPSKSYPFQQHFQNEDRCKKFVHIIQNLL